MAYIFDCKDFENLYAGRESKRRKALIKRVIKAWGHEWAGYLKWLKAESAKQHARLLKQKKDRHGVATKKFLLWMLEMDNPGAYKTNQLLLLFITARLRKTVSKEWKGKGDAYKGPEWLIKEWKDQEEGTKRFDGLSIALTELEYHPLHITWAINSHARRMRVGVARKKVRPGVDHEEKLEISRKLMLLARFHLNRTEEMKRPDQFCAFPPSEGSIGTYILGQEMLNESRIGSQREAVVLASAVRKDIDKLVSKGEWKKDDFEWPKFLKWWTYYVEIRAASAEMNDERRETIRGKQDDLVDKIQDSRLKKHFKRMIQERFKLKIPREPVSTDHLSIRLFEMFRRWRDFDAKKGYEERHSVEYAKFCWSRDQQVRERGFPQMHQELLGPKWRYEGGSPFGPYQRFCQANQKHARRRANEMMREIEVVRSFGPQHAGNLSCLMMELLFRELIYRLWYEVQKMPEDVEHRVDLDYAIGLLVRLKHNIVQLRAFGDINHPAIDKSINKLKILKPTGKAKALGKELRALLDNLDTSSERGEQHWFLGIPYANDGDDFSRKTHAFSHVLEESESRTT